MLYALVVTRRWYTPACLGILKFGVEEIGTRHLKNNGRS